VITVFGSINLDLIGGVGRLPRPGETVPGTSFALAPGGKGANQALAARRAGTSVRMIGAVGRDAFAEPALGLLRADGVDLRKVRAVDGPTGVALILVEQSGENVIAVIPGANGSVSSTDADDLDFSTGSVLLLQLEIRADAIGAAAQRAREKGAAVLLNFAPFLSDALGLLAHATHLIVNESECAGVADAVGLAGGDLEAQAVALSKQCKLTVVVTLGAQGAIAVEDGRLLKAPALKVEAIDTVGAGDTFCGYLAASLSEGLPMPEALRRASAAAGLACTKSGAQPAIPLRAEVEAALSTAKEFAI
jgi:ribokinase